MKHFVILIIFSFFFISTLTAQHGKLDKSFGLNGIVVSGDNYDFCHAMALQPDGKIIQAGEGSCGSKYGFLLRRFNKDGSADASFGKNGCVATQVSEYSAIFSVALQPDGKIIAGGFIITPANLVDFALARYQTNGNLDSSFGENGIIITDLGKDDYLRAIALQQDGKIVVTGVTREDENDNKTSFLMRFLPDGSTDENFGSGGKVIKTFTDGMQISSIAVQPDGKILTGGWFEFKYSFMIVRYQPDGTIDESFGADGIASLGFGLNYKNTDLYALALQEDGKIVGAGITGIGYDNMMALARFNDDGSSDVTFGTDGTVITDFGQYLSEAKSVLIQPDGKIITAGRYYDGFNFSHFAIARHYTNGNIDSSFGKNGLEVTNLGTMVRCEAASLQTDGKILIAGDNAFSFILARYFGRDAVLAITFNNFTVAQHPEGIILNWQTQQETNNDYFTAERSATADAAGYTAIAGIESHGNSSAVQHYSYTDQFPLAGDNYYRLKQTDADGNYSYSATVYIRYTGKSGITIFPNPATDLLTIQGLKASGKNTVSIYDLHGRLLQRFIVQSVSSHSFSVRQLSTGTYIISVQTGSGTERLKFVKK